MKLAKTFLGKVSITVEKDYWSATKSYDRLVIVEVLNVGCYISRQAVPVGIQYDNREYWIKIGKYSEGGTPQPVEFPIVTEFGNSVELTIAQKTLTDRFNDLDFIISGMRVTLNNINVNVVPRLNQVTNSLSQSLGVAENDIDNLEENLQTYKNQLDSLSDNLTSTSNRVDELNDSVVELAEIVGNTNQCWHSSILTQPIAYIGSKTTDQPDDVLMMACLNSNIGISKGPIIRENVMSTTRLRYIVDHFDEFDDIDLWLNSNIIIQLGEEISNETIGEYPPSMAIDLDDPYSDTICGNLAYVMDKINIYARTENNIIPKIFVVFPPLKSPTIQTALENMAKEIGFILVNPYHYRYDRQFSVDTRIVIDSTAKNVVKQGYVEQWCKEIERVVKLNC